jgi:RNA polymerase sigma factor (sigma-70 family)
MLNPTLVAAISADYAGLISLFARRLGDRSLAEDIVNQAFVESLQKLAQQRIADPTRLSGYVYRVAFNLLRNHRRLMANRPETRTSVAVLEGLATDTTPHELHTRNCIAQLVRRVIEDLPVRRDREVIRRFYLDEESKPDICRELHLSYLNFDRIAFRARRRLKALMEAQGLRSSDLLSALSDRRRVPVHAQNCSVAS